MTSNVGIRLPSGAKKIREILDEKNKTPEEKLKEIEEIVDRKLRPKVRAISFGARDPLRPETIKISQGFYRRLKEIIARTRRGDKVN
jgi:hypothetical protein